DDAIIAEDAEFKPLKLKKLIQGSVVLGRTFAARTQPGENVGVLLPNSVGAVVTFFALQCFGRVPAMLNFSAGAKSVCSAINTAQVNTVLTSRRFIAMGRLEDLAAEISKQADLVYLEDIRERIGFKEKLCALLS